MRHIYVHVPFCRRRCSYCDFSIALRREIPGEHYVAAVLREHQLRLDSGEWDDQRVDTLYLGGGTPSLLPSGCVTELIDGLTSNAPAEITIEVNPDDVTEADARSWLAAGVNRVSLGVQSFDPETLKWMHRTHTAHQSARAVQILRDAGIESLSIDLIFGLPDELPRVFEADLELALNMSPEHLSVYGLTSEPRTPFARWVDRGRATPATDARYEREFLLAHDAIVAAGYEHYEVSNYARPAQRSRHNSGYWSGSPYAGLGPSAHRFDGTTRSWNVSAWADYESCLFHGRDPTGGSEKLTGEQMRLETVYLSLRMLDGLSEDQFGDLNREVVERAIAAGWMTSAPGTPPRTTRLALTPAGWLRLDHLVTALTTLGEGG